MNEARKYVPSLELSGTKIIEEKLYFRKGIQVDVVQSGVPIFLTDLTTNTFRPALIAVKRNVPGFWNPLSEHDLNQPPYLDEQVYSEADIGQLEHPRHDSNTFANEKRMLQLVSSVPQLASFTPLLFNTDDKSVATEFIEGTMLRPALESGELDHNTRLGVAAQIMDYVYYLHQNGIQHNDLHGNNIIIKPDGRITVIDYSMAGLERIGKLKYSDINELNRFFIKLIHGGRPSPKDTKKEIRALTRDELSIFDQFETILRGVPFDDDSFNYAYEQYIRTHNCPYGMISMSKTTSSD